MSNTQTGRRLIHFTVEGSGEFPFDMLRYDGCFPASEADARQLYYDHFDRRQVMLSAYVERGSRVPTDERWQSFLWKVVDK